MRRIAPHLVLFFLVAGAFYSGLLMPLEHALMDARFQLIQRDAGGGVTVVEIDSKSLARLESWPWPRRHHARLVDRLVAAGARRIVLDIDFSSPSGDGGDAELLAALKRAKGKIILPLVQQHETPGGATGVAKGGRIAFSAPSAALRKNSSLAHVNVQPEADGLIRRYMKLGRWQGVTFPTLAAALAGSSDLNTFYIDYGIRLDTLPRASYVDILRGDFDKNLIAGRNVIVGATAIGLGARLPTPRYLSVAGPYLHALAYESLVQGRAIMRSSAVVTLLGMLLRAIGFGPWLARRDWRTGGLAAIAVIATVSVLAVAVQGTLPLSLDTVPWIVMVVLSYAACLMGRLDNQSVTLFRQGRALLHRNAMLKGFMDNCVDGIVITDRDGIIEIVNDAAARIVGRAPEELAKGDIGALLPLTADLAPANAAAAKTAPEPMELEVKRGDGTSLPVDISVSALTIDAINHPLERRTGGRTILTYTIRDVTERRRAVEMQQQALDEAVAASRAKSEFIGNMSHELRTPLNSIIGFSEILDRQSFGPLGNDRYAQYAANIHGSGVHLLQIINDILDVSRIETGNYRIQEEMLDLRELANASVRMVRERPEAKGVSIRVSFPDRLPSLRADERLLKQILINLLSNGAKFGGGAEPVVLSASWNPGGELALTVEDKGIGIDGAKISEICAPFYQTDTSLERPFEGTGLGLYLVSQFMKLHGGTLEFESELGRGTRATVRFPAARVVVDGDTNRDTPAETRAQFGS